MTDYSDEDILPRFTYPKWILGTSFVVLGLFVYALVGLRDTTTQIALKQKVITTFDAQNYEKCLQFVHQLPMNGSLAYYEAGSLYALRDTHQFQAATRILKTHAESLKKEQIGHLNDILRPQGYQLSVFISKQLNLIQLQKI